MALSVETSELMEIFQWLDFETSSNPDEKTRERIKEEVADIFIYLLRFCDKLDIDLKEVVENKIKLNAKNIL